VNWRAELGAAQARVHDTAGANISARADRDELIVALVVREGLTYRQLAEATGMSIASIGKIVKAAGEGRYRTRGDRAISLGS
jgi:uncharacterized protein YerC